MKTQTLLRTSTLIGVAGSALSLQASTDYGPAVWRPPCNANYNTSGYGHKFHVIHDMEGYYLSSISMLNGCGWTASSVHYLINGKQDASSDAAAGEVTQSIREVYYAWHARCWNSHSTGCEHEGFQSNPAWYTETQYQASAALTRHLGDTFGWAKDRNHIVGHDEKKNSAWVNWAGSGLGIDPTCNTHSDPGAYWDWNHYMALVNPTTATQHDYIGVLFQSGLFSVKEGIYGSWYNQIAGAGAMQMNGNRFGVIASDGSLKVKEGLQGAWTDQTTPGVVKFQLCGNRIAVLYSDGTLSAKDGLYGTWYNQLGGVIDFYLDGNRIGVIASDTSLKVKEGLQGAWTDQTSPGVVKFQLSGDRIAVLYSNGTLSAKDGLYGTWYDQIGGVVKFQLDGNRIGALVSDGSLKVKEGLQGAWTDQTSPGVVGFKLRGDRIAVLYSDGTLSAKDGLYGTWYNQIGGVTDFYLDGDRIGAVVSDTSLKVKVGIFGGWTDQTTPGVSKFQMTTWTEGTVGGNPSTPPASLPTEVIVDNASAGFSTVGTWSTASSATDKYGTDYRYHSTAAVSESATWTANLTAGTYQIYAWWSQGSNRSTTAPYIVSHSSGSTTVNKNQQAGGGSWQLLGTFNLNGGNNTVQLSCWTTTGYILVADAVRWVKQ